MDEASAIGSVDWQTFPKLPGLLAFASSRIMSATLQKAVLLRQVAGQLMPCGMRWHWRDGRIIARRGRLALEGSSQTTTAELQESLSFAPARLAEDLRRQMGLYRQQGPKGGL